MNENIKIDIKKIKSNLKTSFLGQNIIYHEQLNSTQDEAKRLVNDLNTNLKTINGTYIITDKQTQGKGTKGRIWYDNGYKNICGTFILTPNCHISKLNKLTTILAKCLVQAIKNLYIRQIPNLQLQIKQPNDILCNSKKMVGILTESVTNKEIVKYVFVGIGINVNQIMFNPEIENIATSLKKEFNIDFNREKIISEFFNIFEQIYIELLK